MKILVIKRDKIGDHANLRVSAQGEDLMGPQRVASLTQPTLTAQIDSMVDSVP